MPGFMQFLTGIYLWAGLLLFYTFRAPTLYMAALAFTAFGVHWFSLGMARVLGGDPRPNEFMAVSFAILSALGIVVFFHAGDWPVGLVFVGLAAVYVSEFFASMFILPRSRRVALDAEQQPPSRPSRHVSMFSESVRWASRVYSPVPGSCTSPLPPRSTPRVASTSLCRHCLRRAP